MAYNWNTSKEGGVSLTGKIVQSGNGDFPLLYAKDIDWASVEVGNKTINSTDDLLDLVAGVKSTVDNIDTTVTLYSIVDKATGASSETFEKGSFGDITLCITYSGDVVKNLYIGDITNAEGTKRVLKDSLGNTIDGVYVIDESKVLQSNVIPNTTSSSCTIKIVDTNDAIQAQYTLNVVNKIKSVYSSTVYRITSDDIVPSTPSGLTYSNGAIIFPTGSAWGTYSSIESNISNAYRVWYSDVMFEGTDVMTQTYASEPKIYIRKSDITTSVNPSYSFGVAIYRARKADTDESWTSSSPTGGSYDYSAKTVTPPTEWYTTIDDAVSSLYDTDCYVYVSYNNYLGENNDGTWENTSETGWTIPALYFDIATILEQASDSASKLANTAVADAYSDIEEAKKIIDETSERCTAIVNQLNSDYQWFFFSASSVPSKYTNITDTDDANFASLKNSYGDYELDSVDVLNITMKDTVCTSDYQNKALWLERYGTGYDSQLGYVAYVPTSTELLTQMSEIDTEMDTLKTSVNKITPDYIRLQSSTGYLSNVTWTRVYSIPSGVTATTISSFPTSGYTYGNYYKKGTEYYRCDYPITTGFMDILAGKVSLGSAKTIDGNTISSTITLKVDGKSSDATIAADTIRLTGTTLADAIKAQDLNINNITYLKSTGEVLFAQGTSGASAFYTNGIGSLAGGNISWTSDGSLTTKGTIKAEGGYIGGENGWTIGVAGTIPAMYAFDGSNKLTIATTYIENSTNSTTHWKLDNDGNAQFSDGKVQFNNTGAGSVASGNIRWTADGDATIKGAIQATDFTTYYNGFQAMHMTTVGQLADDGYTDVITKAGLDEASSYTPVLLIDERDTDGNVVNRYIVNLTKIQANSSTDTSTIVGYLNYLTTTSSYTCAQLVSSSNTIFNTSIDKVTTTTGDSTTVTYSPAGTYYSTKVNERNASKSGQLDEWSLIVPMLRSDGSASYSSYYAIATVYKLKTITVTSTGYSIKYSYIAKAPYLISTTGTTSGSSTVYWGYSNSTYYVIPGSAVTESGDGQLLSVTPTEGFKYKLNSHANVIPTDQIQLTASSSTVDISKFTGSSSLINVSDGTSAPYSNI